MTDVDMKPAWLDSNGGNDESVKNFSTTLEPLAAASPPKHVVSSSPAPVAAGTGVSGGKALKGRRATSPHGDRNGTPLTQGILSGNSSFNEQPVGKSPIALSLVGPNGGSGASFKREASGLSLNGAAGLSGTSIPSAHNSTSGMLLLGGGSPANPSSLSPDQQLGFALSNGTGVRPVSVGSLGTLSPPLSNLNGGQSTMEYQLAALKEKRKQRAALAGTTSSNTGSSDGTSPTSPVPPAIDNTSFSRRPKPLTPRGSGSTDSHPMPGIAASASARKRSSTSNSSGGAAASGKPPTGSTSSSSPHSGTGLEKIVKNLQEKVPWDQQSKAVGQLRDKLLLLGGANAGGGAVEDMLEGSSNALQQFTEELRNGGNNLMPNLVNGLLGICDNSRSSLAKSALDTTGLLCSRLGSVRCTSIAVNQPIVVDAQADLICSKLILKAGGASKFLIDSTTFSLRELMFSIHPHKAFHAVFAMAIPTSNLPKTEKSKSLVGEALAHCYECSDPKLFLNGTTVIGAGSPSGVSPSKHHHQGHGHGGGSENSFPVIFGKTVQLVESLIHDAWPDVRDSGRRAAMNCSQFLKELITEMESNGGSVASLDLDGIIHNSVEKSGNLEKVAKAFGRDPDDVASAGGPKQPAFKTSPTTANETPRKQSQQKRPSNASDGDGSAVKPAPPKKSTTGNPRNANGPHATPGKKPKTPPPVAKKKPVTPPAAKKQPGAPSAAKRASQTPERQTIHTKGVRNQRKPSSSSAENEATPDALKNTAKPSNNKKKSSVVATTSDDDAGESEIQKKIAEKNVPPIEQIPPPATPPNGSMNAPFSNNSFAMEGISSPRALISPRAFTETLGKEMQQHGDFSLPLFAAQEGNYQERYEAISKIFQMCEDQLMMRRRLSFEDIPKETAKATGGTPPPLADPNATMMQRSARTNAVPESTGLALCEVIALRCADTNNKVQLAALECLPSLLRIVPRSCVDATAPKFVSCLTTSLSSGYAEVAKNAATAMRAVVRNCSVLEANSLMYTIATTAVSVRNENAKLVLSTLMTDLVERQRELTLELAEGKENILSSSAKEGGSGGGRHQKLDARFVFEMNLKLLTDEREAVHTKASLLLLALRNGGLLTDSEILDNPELKAREQWKEVKQLLEENQVPPASP